jgi:hypothetical protein
VYVFSTIAPSHPYVGTLPHRRPAQLKPALALLLFSITAVSTRKSYREAQGGRSIAHFAFYVRHTALSIWGGGTIHSKLMNRKTILDVRRRSGTLPSQGRVRAQSGSRYPLVALCPISHRDPLLCIYCAVFHFQSSLRIAKCFFETRLNAHLECGSAALLCQGTMSSRLDD